MTGLILDVGGDWLPDKQPHHQHSHFHHGSDGEVNNTNWSVLASYHSPKITCRVSAMTWLIPRNIPCSHTGSMEFLSTWISISSPWSHLSIEHSECVPSGIFLWNTLIFKAAFHSNFQNIFPLHLWIHLQADSDFWFISSTCLTGAVLAQCGGEEHTPWIVTLWSVEAFSQITFS